MNDFTQPDALVFDVCSRRYFAMSNSPYSLRAWSEHWTKRLIM